MKMITFLFFFWNGEGLKIQLLADLRQQNSDYVLIFCEAVLEMGF